ncbi:MAG: TIR domain-containing protein [Leptolyngbya sp. SIO4C1]|nr:TIR domain-containing protein [Leptolyngbya sp. SIO4C1]
MLDQVIPAALRAIAAIAKAPAQRSQRYIKTLKQFEWDPEHPPAEFSAVYAYTLVEYALADESPKSETLLQLFAEPEIKAAFRQAFDQWQMNPLADALAHRLDWQAFGNEWNFIGNAIREQNIDVQREVTVFFAAFLEVVKRSQTPKEQIHSILLTEQQRDLQQLRSELAQVVDVDLLAKEVAEQILDKSQAASTTPKGKDFSEDVDIFSISTDCPPLSYGTENINKGNKDIANKEGYEYYIFLSYRRFGEWPKWVRDKFMPLFKHYLGEEIGRNPKIFVDVESIDTGVSWPNKLGSALAKSCVLVPLFSRQYFSSEWCQLELSNMLAREKKYGFNTPERPERLIVPAKIHDGHDFPHFIKDIQCACLEKCSNVRMAEGSRREEELAELIEKWVPNIASAIERAPSYNENWHQLAVNEFMELFKKHKPKSKKLPRLS